jgi:hypothetical protein
MGKAKRKVRPQPPRHFWYDVDGCWFCKKKNACGNCKVAKQYIAEKQKVKRKMLRDEKRSFDFE